MVRVPIDYLAFFRPVNDVSNWRCSVSSLTFPRFSCENFPHSSNANFNVWVETHRNSFHKKSFFLVYEHFWDVGLSHYLWLPRHLCSRNELVNVVNTGKETCSSRNTISPENVNISAVTGKTEHACLSTWSEPCSKALFVVSSFVCQVSVVCDLHQMYWMWWDHRVYKGEMDWSETSAWNDVLILHLQTKNIQFELFPCNKTQDCQTTIWKVFPRGFVYSGAIRNWGLFSNVRKGVLQCVRQVHQVNTTMSWFLLVFTPITGSLPKSRDGQITASWVHLTVPLMVRDRIRKLWFSDQDRYETIMSRVLVCH